MFAVTLLMVEIFCKNLKNSSQLLILIILKSRVYALRNMMNVIHCIKKRSHKPRLKISVKILLFKMKLISKYNLTHKKDFRSTKREQIHLTYIKQMIIYVMMMP